MHWFKVVIIVMLIAIVASLGTALFGLVNDRGRSDRTVKWLTIRVILSVSLVIMMLIAYHFGIIQPHGVAP
jgi:MFS-type transporter involved in bile tolerance (Atg22 family)